MKKKDQSTLTQGVRGKTAASQQRRQDIVGAAKTVFFEQGYQLASMDRIAAAAHTTKRTLYDHFGDKDALFAASVEQGCRGFVEQLPRSEDLSPDTTVALRSFIRRMASLLNAPEAIRFVRMVIAEAERHPEFGRILNQAAFIAAEKVLQDYLERQIERGKLRPHDVSAWTPALIGLVTNLEHTQALLGLTHAQRKGHSDEAQAEIIAIYVRTFSC
jgi:TetR/AcrR family transcriptional repressor of mexJK operon